MADLAKLVVRLEGESSQLRRELGQANEKLQKFGSSVTTTMAKAKRALTGFALGFISFQAIRSATTELANFTSTLSAVQAVTGASQKQMASLTKTARQLGATTVFSANEAAQGMEFLGRAGFSTTEIIQAMPGLLSLASAGALDLARAADIASNVLSGFGETADQSNRVADILAATAASSNTSVEQLGEAMSYVAPVANAFGKSIEETSAALGILGNAGIQASTAGTGLRGIMSKLAGATPEAEAALATMGLTLQQVNPETKSLTEIVNTLADAGLRGGQALTIFGERAGPAILALTSQRDELNRMVESMDHVEGRAAAMAKTMSDNLTGDTKALVSALAELTQQLGEAGVTSALRSAVQGLTDFTRGISDLVRGPSLKELQAKLDLIESRGGGSGQMRRAGRGRGGGANRIRGQIQEQLEALEGAEGVRAKLARVEDEIGQRQARIESLVAEINTIPDSERQTSRGRGRSKILTRYGGLNKELMEANRELAALKTERGGLFDELAELEFNSADLELNVEGTGRAASTLTGTLQANNSELSKSLELLNKQKATFDELVQKARESINKTEVNPLIKDTPFEAIRSLDRAQGLSKRGKNEDALKEAEKAVEVVTRLAEANKISDSYANTLLNKAAKLGATAVENQMKLNIDAEGAQEQMDKLGQDLLEKANANPIKWPVQLEPMPSDGPMLQEGAWRSDGTPLTLNFGGSEYNTTIPSKDAQRMAPDLERESMKRGSRC